jgi:hypothetical protein
MGLSVVACCLLGCNRVLVSESKQWRGYKFLLSIDNTTGELYIFTVIQEREIVKGLGRGLLEVQLLVDFAQAFLPGFDFGELLLQRLNLFLEGNRAASNNEISPLLFRFREDWTKRTALLRRFGSAPIVLRRQ